MNVNVVLEEAFDGHQGNDLYDPERAHYRVFRVRKQATVAELMEMLADTFKYPLKQLRPWPFSARSNQVRTNPFIMFYHMVQLSNLFGYRQNIFLLHCQYLFLKVIMHTTF